MSIFNVLEWHSRELHSDVVALREGLPRQFETIEERIRDLRVAIVGNTKTIVSDLSDHSKLYRDLVRDLAGLDSQLAARLIKEIEKIQYQSEFRKIASQPKMLAEWLNKHQNAFRIQESDFQFNPERVLRAFEALLRNVKPRKNFEEVFDTEMSKMVVSSLKLYDKTVIQVRSLFTDPRLRAMALGYFINEKWIHLSELNLSFQELKLIAPYLTHVDCRQVQFKDDAEAQEFVQSCSNAYFLEIDSDKITELNPSSVKLQTLLCSECRSLRKLVLSDLLSLQFLHSWGCPALNEVALSNLPSLETINLFNCTSLKTLILSNLPLLENLDFSHCTAMRSAALNNLPSLEKLEFSNCTAIRSAALNTLPSLREVRCNFCTTLTELFLFNLPLLKEIEFSHCTSLEKINSNGLPRCSYVDRRNCPKLTDLPKLEANATVDTTLFNIIERQYRDLHTDVEALREGLPRTLETLEKKIGALYITIAGNAKTLTADLSDHSKLYRDIVRDLAKLDFSLAVQLIKDIEKIHFQSGRHIS